MRNGINELERLPGALLPILHALQEEFGYIDAAATPMIAEALSLSQAEVHGVISFYHDFRHAAPERHVMKICRAALRARTWSLPNLRIGPPVVPNTRNRTQ
jgi:formate dehydrogenase subunit gamma